MSAKDKDGSKKPWEDLVMSAVDKLANAPAMDWVKGIRSEIQDRLSAEIANRLAQIDWDNFARKIGDHLAENFDVEMKISLKPKRGSKKNDER